MAINKKNAFEEDAQTLAAFAKALSHPARLEIIKYLAKKDSCICGEIVDVLPLSQSTVSQHLKELKKSGIVQGTIDGVRSCYCLDWDFLSKKITEFNFFTQQLTKNKPDNCC